MSGVLDSAIYLLLMVSLVGCFVPRLGVCWRTWRAAPPATPRRLERLPDHTAYHTDEPPDVVLARAALALRRRRYRVVESRVTDSVRAERGRLREAGNLLFHVSVLVVLVGFAAGSLLGYRGGVILVVGSDFSNNPTQYDEFEPGGPFDPQSMEPFSLDLDSFDEQWVYGGPRAGMAQRFLALLAYQETPGAARREYDLRVNHPLAIGGTEVFLIGHGYAPVITIRDGNGDVAYRAPRSSCPPTRRSARSGWSRRRTRCPPRSGWRVSSTQPTTTPGRPGRSPRSART